MKEFIWANLSFKENVKSNQAFEGIRANKKVQKSINIIMVVMEIIHMIMAIKMNIKLNKSIFAPSFMHTQRSILESFSIGSCMIKLVNSCAIH